MKIQLNSSWINGKYSWKDSAKNVIECEINTSFEYVAIGENYFWQGEEANQVIDEIHQIWLKGRCSVKTAVKKYANLYLSEL